MRKLVFGILFLMVLGGHLDAALLINHTSVEDFGEIPSEWISTVQNNYELHHCHRSHGRQISEGMRDVVEPAYPEFDVTVQLEGLTQQENSFSIYDDLSCYQGEYWDGTPPRMVQMILNSNPTINTSAWCWCGEFRTVDQSYVDEYLVAMEALEQANPGVKFIYMTDHAQRLGTDAQEYNRYMLNEYVRTYCRDHNKTLFDFGDLDAWWFNSTSGQWEHSTFQYNGVDVPYQHPQFDGEEIGHTTYESAGQKGKAFWVLMARMAGWQDSGGNLFSIPYINSVSGNLSDEETVTISGNNFGSAGPEVILFDDFEEGVNGSLLSESAPLIGNWSFVGNQYPDRATYSSIQSRSGYQSMYSGIYQWSGFNVELSEEDSLFYGSYWFRYDLRGADTTQGEIKAFQLWGTVAPLYHPLLLWGSAPNPPGAPWGFALFSKENVDYNEGISNFEEDTWHHAELILRQSDINLSNGYVHLKINGETEIEIDNLITRTVEGSYWRWWKWFLGCSNFERNGQPQPVYWMDDTYLSNSWARVEIGDSPTYNSCTHREIQIPQQWSDGSITFTANQGPFSNGETAYIFVVDENGNVSSGRQITFANDSNPPGPPIYATPHVQNYITLQEMLSSIEDYKRGLTPIEQVVANIKKFIWG